MGRHLEVKRKEYRKKKKIEKKNKKRAYLNQLKNPKEVSHENKHVAAKEQKCEPCTDLDKPDSSKSIHIHMHSSHEKSALTSNSECDILRKLHRDPLYRRFQEYKYLKKRLSTLTKT